MCGYMFSLFRLGESVPHAVTGDLMAFHATKWSPPLRVGDGKRSSSNVQRKQRTDRHVNHNIWKHACIDSGAVVYTRELVLHVNAHITTCVGFPRCMLGTQAIAGKE